MMKKARKYNDFKYFIGFPQFCFWEDKFVFWGFLSFLGKQSCSVEREVAICERRITKDDVKEGH